jgi:hypothetical protein
VGTKLSVNENTARMRVERALEKLRSLLAKRGITTGTALASVISANAVQTAPASLSGSLATAALSGTGTGAFSFFQTINMAKLKLGLGTLATAGVIAAVVVQLHAQRTLRAENESLSAQLAQLKADNEQLSNQIAANANSMATQKDQTAELLKLRAEVTQLRQMKAAPAVAITPITNNLPVPKQIEINLKARFVSIPAEDAPSFGAGWTSEGADTSLLSEQQFGFVISALEARKATLLNEGEVTTLSGRSASFQVTETIPINGTNFELGPVLDVMPFYSSDSSIFSLNLTAMLSQLTGDASQPGVATTQMSNQVSVFAGQTVALKAVLPAGDWLPDSKALGDGPRELLVFVTPTLIDAKGEPQPAGSADVSRESAMEKMSEAKQGVLALIMFADDNGNQYPANLDDAARYMKNDYMKTVESNFDFLNPGSITNVAQPATTIVLKEKQAWQGPDGGWLKAYGFADGHAEIHREPTGNFDEFEKEHTLAANGQ